jgi:hypothetical protein
MVKVNLVGFKQFQDLLKKAPERLVQDLDGEVKLAAENFRDLAVKDAPKDRAGGSGLSGSIVVKNPNTLTWEVVVQKDYAPYLEFGTKLNFRAIPGIDSSVYKGKGKGTAEQALESIKAWVKRKGIKFQSAGTFRTGKKKGQNKNLTLEQTAYIIFHFIMLRGIKAQPFFFKQIPIVRRDFFRRVRERLKL